MMALNPLYVPVHLNLVAELENAENQRTLHQKFRTIRDSSNLFELPNERFKKLFRLSKHSVLMLIQELKELVPEPSRRHAVPFHLQIMATLIFCGHGGYQATVGEDCNLGISQPVVSRLINKITNLFTIHLLPRYVQFPVTNEEVANVKDGFTNAGFQFPNVIGTIDATHVTIVPPKVDDPVNPAISYLNRKGFYSINTQAIFDAKLIILNINARYPGATHDSAIWEMSSIQRHLRHKYEEGRRDCYLLGDSGYPLQPWLMTLIPDPLPNTPENAYNECHIRTRNVVERGFGTLKARFRCLRKDRVLHYSHATAGKIIYTCAVLHNICRKYNDDIDDSDDDGENEHPDDHLGAIMNIHPNINNDIDVLTEGRYIRRQIVGQLAAN